MATKGQQVLYKGEERELKEKKETGFPLKKYKEKKEKNQRKNQLLEKENENLNSEKE